VHRLVIPLLLAGLLGGCTGDAADRVREARDRAEGVVEDARRIGNDLDERIREARAEAERVSDRLADRVREELERLRQQVPTAGPATRPPQATDTRASAMDRYLTRVLRSVDRYWTRTLTASGVEEPQVRYVWVPPGRRVGSACGEGADDRAAFYCPRDDTIFVGQTLAAEIYDGVARGFPGQEAGEGRAAGDFGVAYLVAHEYAHNLQAELGFLSAGGGGSAKPFELQADCFAGLWGNSVYRAGRLKPGDVEEAMETAKAVGDFEVDNAQHHGTPTERRDAWLLGFESGDPSDCRHFVVA
jgi:hypothetical protein